MNFEQIINFIHAQNPIIIYAVLLLSAYTENIFPPFPGDAVTLAGIFVAGAGEISYIGVMISVVLGGTLGAMSLYFLGKYKGRAFFTTGSGRKLTGGHLEKVDKLFGRFGAAIIIGGRFFPGIRSAIAVTAGIARMDVVRMIILTTLSFIVWNGILMGLMIYSKSNWRMIIDLVKQYNIILIIIALVIVIIWMAQKLWKKRNSR